MVPLEERAGYFKRIEESPKLKSFFNMLSITDFDMQNDQGLNESEEIYYGVINSLMNNNKNDFESLYNKKSKSRPTQDSPAPFINDDFLIFCLLVGVIKFSVNSSWLKYIISIRSRNVLTITFENILNDNNFSKSNSPMVVIMFLNLINKNMITDEFADFTFKKISNDKALFENRSDFHIICSLCAYDLIILLKKIPDNSELESYRVFSKKFQKRTLYLVYIIQFLFYSLLVYLILNLPSYSEEAIALIEKYNYAFTLSGGLGFSLLGNLIPVFKDQCHRIVKKILGYPKELL